MDMYDDELFECILNPKAGSNAKPLVYKYFSDVAENLRAEYFGGMSEMANASDRRTLLGSSIAALQPWAQGGQFSEQKCLLKVYDDLLSTFKLNDVVTVIGILECPI